jgi:hypothetical protein
MVFLDVLDLARGTIGRVYDRITGNAFPYPVACQRKPLPVLRPRLEVRHVLRVVVPGERTLLRVVGEQATTLHLRLDRL